MAADKTYYFGTSAQRTNITFESTTDFEVILGTANQADGMIRADLEKGTGSVEISVPVASLRTGIELRDEHMRSAGWLDAEKYPQISFTSDNVKQGDDGLWKAVGTFSLHGVSKPLAADVEVREIPAELASKAGLEAGDWLRISTAFEVKLSDFGVKIPDMAAAKVNDTWKIKVLAFTNSAPAKQAAK